jgi:hypothetical protein
MKPEMKEIARQIRSFISTVQPRLYRMNHEKMGFKPSPHGWPEKEILGHLIDSVANNHQRYAEAVNNVIEQFPAYIRNEWVQIQRYNEISCSFLVTLFSAYNVHLSQAIECIPVDAQSSPCSIGKGEPVALEFVVKDYLRHLKYHIKDILGKQKQPA